MVLQPPATGGVAVSVPQERGGSSEQGSVAEDAGPEQVDRA
jgi:hypothetical protein